MLALCLVLILICFRIDSARQPVSPSLWIPTIWMLIGFSRPINTWLPSEGVALQPGQYFEGNPVDATVLSALMLAATLVLLARPIRWRHIVRVNWWLVALLAFAALSITWSEYPLIALKRWLRAWGPPLMALVILTDGHPREALVVAFRRCAYVLGPLSVVLYKYYPELGRSYHPMSGELSITGVTAGKNNLGALCLFFGLFLLWNLLTDRPTSRRILLVRGANLCTLLWLLFNSDSMDSLICFAVGAALLFGLRSRRLRSRMTLFAWPAFAGIGVLIATLIVGGANSLTESAVGATGHSMTFLGRIDLWSQLIAMIPTTGLGAGYGSFWLGPRLEALWAMYWWQPTEAHNGYVGTFLELGWGGLILLTCMLASTLRANLENFSKEPRLAPFTFSLFFVIVLYNIAESTLDFSQPIWFLLLLARMVFGVMPDETAPTFVDPTPLVRGPHGAFGPERA
jgi:exopolysaccharide production protein ExoQ